MQDSPTIQQLFFRIQHDPEVKGIQSVINSYFSKGTNVARFIPLDNILVKLIPVLEKNSCTIEQDFMIRVEGGITIGRVRTTLASDLDTDVKEFIHEEIIDKANPHGSGSAETYAKRRGLCSAFGLCGEVDDDGNLASLPVKTEANGEKRISTENGNQRHPDTIAEIEARTKKFREIRNSLGLSVLQAQELFNDGKAFSASPPLDVAVALLEAIQDYAERSAKQMLTEREKQITNKGVQAA